MNKLFRIHFSGTVAREQTVGPLILIGNLLSTEFCLSNGILYSHREMPTPIYPIYDMSGGTTWYGELKEWIGFWKYSSLPTNGFYTFDNYDMSYYRRFIIRYFL